MFYLVWHKRVERFFESKTGVVDLTDYDLVCKVVAEKLDQVYRLCNIGRTLEDPWFENDEVTLVLNLEGARSLSVGDLVFEGGTGILWEVASIGWNEVQVGA